MFIQADATKLPFADDSFDLVLGSPPYANARLYLEGGRNPGISRKAVEWVEFMLKATMEAVRVSKGLVLWVASGVTRDWCYWPCVEGLMWEWFKSGNRLWRPAFWHRVGIPGSGGKQWLRADIEYVLAFTKCEAMLPWADNTSNGHPPKWAPGGEMSYRDADGNRRNGCDAMFSGGNGARGQGRNAKGEKCSKPRLVNGKDAMGFHKYGGRGKDKNGVAKKPRSISRGHGTDGEPISEEAYVPPKLANPGVLVTEESISELEFLEVIHVYCQRTNTPGEQVLRDLREAIDSQSISRWFARICSGIIESSLLQSRMQRHVAATPGRSENGRTSSSREKDRSTKEEAGKMRAVRNDSQAGSPPQGRGRDEQFSGQSGGSLLDLPSQGAQEGELFRTWLHVAFSRSGILQQALDQIQEVWRSARQMLWQIEADESPNLIQGIKVGGGLMGHKLSHLNEAPFPLKLAQWFIRGWCPPGGRVLDPFSGSGTVVHAAHSLGRIGIGCDLRFSQCELGRRRMMDVQSKAAEVPA